MLMVHPRIPSVAAEKTFALPGHHNDPGQRPQYRARHPPSDTQALGKRKGRNKRDSKDTLMPPTFNCPYRHLAGDAPRPGAAVHQRKRFLGIPTYLLSYGAPPKNCPISGPLPVSTRTGAAPIHQQPLLRTVAPLHRRAASHIRGCVLGKGLPGGEIPQQHKDRTREQRTPKNQSSKATTHMCSSCE
jgi:hypothetical protein